jgi:hypothetical protein
MTIMMGYYVVQHVGSSGSSCRRLHHHSEQTWHGTCDMIMIAYHGA